MFLVDTNVLLDVFTGDGTWRAWSELIRSLPGGFYIGAHAATLTA